MRKKFANQGRGIIAGLMFVLAVGCLCVVAAPSAVRGFTPKSAGDSLEAADWNALRVDFLAADGDAIADNSMLGDLNMAGGFRVTDVGDPSAGTDGASRQWILDRIADRTGAGGGGTIVCGTTPTDLWYDYGSQTIAINVDTTSSTLAPNFSSTPLYFTALGGASQHFRVSNAVTTINRTASGFTAVVGIDLGAASNANSWDWVINWCGMGN